MSYYYVKSGRHKLIRNPSTLLQNEDGLYIKCGANKLILSSVVGKRRLPPEEKPQKRIKLLRTHCKYYEKHGFCEKGNSCPFIHDETKKPICKFYLKGTCTKGPNCPFRHASMKDVICPRFLKGTCTLGKNCPYSHIKETKVCETFSKQGTCPFGNKCKFIHPKMKKKKNNLEDCKIIPQFSV